MCLNIVSMECMRGPMLVGDVSLLNIHVTDRAVLTDLHISSSQLPKSYSMRRTRDIAQTTSYLTLKEVHFWTSVDEQQLSRRMKKNILTGVKSISRPLSSPAENPLLLSVSISLLWSVLSSIQSRGFYRETTGFSTLFGALFHAWFCLLNPSH